MVKNQKFPNLTKDFFNEKGHIHVLGENIVYFNLKKSNSDFLKNNLESLHFYII